MPTTFDELLQWDQWLTEMVQSADSGEPLNFIEQVENFITQAREAGRYISDRGKRRTLRGMLRRWNNYLAQQHASCPLTWLLPYEGREESGSIPPEKPPISVLTIPPETVPVERYRTDIHGPVIGPVHTGTGDIIVNFIDYARGDPACPKPIKLVLDEEANRVVASGSLQHYVLPLSYLLFRRIVLGKDSTLLRMDIRRELETKLSAQEAAALANLLRRWGEEHLQGVGGQRG